MLTTSQEFLRKLLSFIEVEAIPEPDQLDLIKKYIELTASTLTLIAVIVGAIWTYWLFVRTRQKFPSANLTQKIDYHIIAEDKLWLRVTITLQNTSKVLLSLVYAKTWVQQVTPVSEEILEKINQGEEPLDAEGMEYLWPLAVKQKEKDWPKGSREIEPGESDQVFFDFILSPEIEILIVYSYFRNAKKFNRKKELGWQITSVYDVKSINGGNLNERENNCEKRGTGTPQTSTSASATTQGWNEAGTTETTTSGQEVSAEATVTVEGENDKPEERHRDEEKAT